MLWLNDRNGNLFDWITQRWVQLTGQLVNIDDYPWLDGPIGKTTGIGGDYFSVLAKEENILVASNENGAGLLPAFNILAGDRLKLEEIDQAVIDFYEKTSRYELEAKSSWNGFFRPFGWLISTLFSHRLNQLNIPSSTAGKGSGVTSRIIQLIDSNSKMLKYSGWVREHNATGRVIFIGSYQTEKVPGCTDRCVKAVFPLPNGNATVFLKASNGPDRSLVLESSGKKFGDPGFYFSVVRDDKTRWVRYLPYFKETLRVFKDPSSELRAEHHFFLWGCLFLKLHYRLSEKTEQGSILKGEKT